MQPRPAVPLTDERFGALYDRLRQLARNQLRRNERATLLDTTGLVHEAYLRMADDVALNDAEPGQFLAYASRVMRFVVIDHVRARHAERRGGDQVHVTLDTAVADQVAMPEAQWLDLHAALEQLAQVDERLVRLVEMRCFGGLSEAEIAAALKVTTRTVQRQWQKARALLQVAMQR